MDVYDIAGRHVAELTAIITMAFGGFAVRNSLLQRMNILTVHRIMKTTEYMKNLAAIYRLAGDTYKNHVDPEAAKSKGFRKPFYDGLMYLRF